MASPKKRSTTRAKAARQEKTVCAPRRSESRPLIALGLFFLALGLAFALWDYNENQSFFFHDSLFSGLAHTTDLYGSNGVGQLGATAAILLFNFAGIGAFFLPFGLLVAAWTFLFHRAHTLFPWKLLLIFGGFFAFVGLLGMVDPGPGTPSAVVSMFGLEHYMPKGAGGALGTLLYDKICLPFLGEIGGAFLLVFAYGFCLLGIFVDDPRRIIADAIHRMRERWEKNMELRRQRADARREIRERRAAERTDAHRQEHGDFNKPLATYTIAPANKTPDITLTENDDSLSSFPAPEPEEIPEEEPEPDLATAPQIEFPSSDDEPAAAPAPRAAKEKPSRTKLTIHGEETVERASGTLSPKRKGDYVFPPVTLLKEPPPADNSPSENYEERSEALVRTLGEFKIKVEPGEIQVGPVITRYEVTPAAGVRVEKIAGLANNLAMSLKAESVRVLAPVPGKGTVGVEVPNRKPKAVSIREIIESKPWQENKCEIPVVLGKDVTGKPMIVDLARMPHCLIAGSTGSGKSVCINGIVASLVYHAGPDDLRFIMVDPKVVELQVYNNLPHMLIPVVTEPKKVPGALKWLISEMENRYRIFAKSGVKNITGFNAKISKDHEEAERARQMDLELSAEERLATSQVEVPRDDGVLEIPEKKLPYIVCIIDELADLMMVAPADIETAIARLAQLARAAGIHLILATQRPSVNVITGIIKANLPCRIAFKVTSLIDSRTILDQKGAEGLIGRGDMLFVPPGSAHLVRAQGAFVSEEEISNLVEHIAEHNGEPDFADDVQEAIELAAMEGDDNAPTEGTDDPSEDPLLAKAWEVIRTSERASTSMVQRRLSIGYNRAARIIDTLHERGYIGPENGSSPREILKHD